MRVGQLKEKLSNVDDELEIVVDADEDEFFMLEDLEVRQCEGAKDWTVLNLISSNESQVASLTARKDLPHTFCFLVA